MKTVDYSNRQLINKRFVTKNNANKPAFKGNLSSGLDKFRKATLNKAADLSESSLAPMFISTLGIMAFRPPIIMSDKKTPKNDRIFTASWLFALSACALGVFSATQGPINRLGDKLAIKAFNLDPKGTFAKKSKDLLKQAKDSTNKENAKSLAKKGKDVFKLIFNEQTTKEGIKKVQAAQGLSKLIGFIGLGVVVSNINTILVTRYLERTMDKLSQKFLGRPATDKPKKPETEEQKAKRQKTDKCIAGSIAALGALTILHKATKGEGGSIVTKPLKSLSKALKLDVPFKPMAKKLQQGAEHNQNSRTQRILRSFAPELTPDSINFEKFGMKNLAPNADLKTEKAFIENTKPFLDSLKEIPGKIGKDGNAKLNRPFDWTYASVGSNVIMRPIILGASKQLYSAINATSSEALALGSTMAISGLVDKAAPKFQKLLGAQTRKERAGADFITNQLIKNVGVICIAMGFANNVVSRAILNVFKGQKKGKKPESDKTQAPQEKQQEIASKKVKEEETKTNKTAA